MIINLKDIKVLKNYSPRKEVNSEAITNYKENYELGDNLPSLIIQKEEKILVDGFHRYYALKELEKETKIHTQTVDIGGHKDFLVTMNCHS
ncbi:hypothetical protein DRO66_06005 [Candidatus Bathyarchaeota archaeon]|nr:MAG: hypothetical protein DRO66_06005 [Candidatus Bathyarchaeota archaeon]